MKAESKKVYAKLPDYLNEEEVKQILDVAKKENHKHWLILLTLWETGLRANELVNLKTEDIVPASKNYPANIHVRQGKGGKDRYIPISDNLFNLLKIFTNNKKGYIFKNKSGKKLSTTSVWLIVNKYAEKAQINRIKVHPHTFRHSRAVYLLKHGMTLSELSKFLGHKLIQSTFIYIEILPKEMQLRYKDIVEKEQQKANLEYFKKITESD